jgi:hypothetical protein
MFNSQNTNTLTLSYNHDPAADDDLYAFKAMQTLEIVSASFTCDNGIFASATDYFDVALYNGGTAGTATTAIGGTVGGVGGWLALSPKDFTILNGTVTTNQVVYLRYNEVGLGTFGAGVLQINYRLGTT